MKISSDYFIKKNTQIFLKKFNYQRITLNYLASILTHSCDSLYLTHFNKEQILTKTNSYLVINLYLTQNMYKKSLNFLDKTINNGGRCWIIDSFEIKEEQKKQIKILARSLLLKKLHNFLLIGLNKKYFNILSLHNYSRYGLLTNFRWFQYEQTTLKENYRLHEFLKINNLLDKLQEVKVNQNTSFFPDLVIINKTVKKWWEYLNNEIKKVSISGISLNEIKNQNNSYLYSIPSNNNHLTELFFLLIIIKTILKTISLKINRFEIYSNLIKINLKKKIFLISLIKIRKNRSKHKTKNWKTLANIEKALFKKVKLMINNENVYMVKHLQILSFAKYQIYKKLLIKQKIDLFGLWYYRLVSRWRVNKYFKEIKRNKINKIRKELGITPIQKKHLIIKNNKFKKKNDDKNIKMLIKKKNFKYNIRYLSNKDPWGFFLTKKIINIFPVQQEKKTKLIYWILKNKNLIKLNKKQWKLWNRKKNWEKKSSGYFEFDLLYPINQNYEDSRKNNFKKNQKIKTFRRNKKLLYKILFNRCSLIYNNNTHQKKILDKLSLNNLNKVTIKYILNSNVINDKWWTVWKNVIKQKYQTKKNTNNANNKSLKQNLWSLKQIMINKQHNLNVINKNTINQNEKKLLYFNFRNSTMQKKRFKNKSSKIKESKIIKELNFGLYTKWWNNTTIQYKKFKWLSINEKNYSKIIYKTQDNLKLWWLKQVVLNLNLKTVKKRQNNAFIGRKKKFTLNEEKKFLQKLPIFIYKTIGKIIKTERRRNRKRNFKQKQRSYPITGAKAYFLMKTKFKLKSNKKNVYYKNYNITNLYARLIYFWQTYKKWKKKKFTLWNSNIILNRKLRIFYFFRKNQLKRLLHRYSKRKNQAIDSLFLYLESLLLIFIYRLNLFSSMYFIKQIINHGYISIGKNFIKKEHYKIKLWIDEVRITFKSIKHKRNWLRHVLFNKQYTNQIILNYPKYIEFNYKLLIGKIVRKPLKKELYFPSNSLLTKKFFN